MGDKTKIEWAEATINPVIGCSKVSAGCDNCYAERMAGRLANIPATHDAYSKVVWWMHNTDGSGFFQWNGITAFVESALDKPLRWKKPRRIFVCSMGDLFHESVDFYWQAQVLSVIAECQHHTFMVLTKRPHIMADFFSRHEVLDYCPNLWLGVTAENQQAADERIPILLQTPAAVRFVSVEPMLGPVDLRLRGNCSHCFKYGNQYHIAHPCEQCGYQGGVLPIDWVIAGGESGPGARPMQPEWVRGLRDQCQGVGVPFLFKQWGEWQECPSFKEMDKTTIMMDYYGRKINANERFDPVVGDRLLSRLGKKKAGRLLDGVTWDQFPEGRR